MVFLLFIGVLWCEFLEWKVFMGIGLVILVFLVGVVLGFVLGGVIFDYWDWWWMFWVSVLLFVVLMVLMWFFVSESECL